MRISFRDYRRSTQVDWETFYIQDYESKSKFESCIEDLSFNIEESFDEN